MNIYESREDYRYILYQCTVPKYSVYALSRGWKDLVIVLELLVSIQEGRMSVLEKKREGVNSIVIIYNKTVTGARVEKGIL